ncbi:LLM class flavin-dependent oxidoreductase [Nitrospirillum sp. BR 11828]|uniref:LLM class flavin-dependent oxidoreductase n=1 Tax=Nitrospirillum sp. BR 11828 TaxID=3104325 RepID=UPI002ACAC628|nr:LLM class flavin-dependent oxidoreductase [Nitrospirillum sp. BR 11828]MDZ5649747.1 LLM class flavin-dependent oxidoreductase [Nitrospirillum sp. BR 11828]
MKLLAFLMQTGGHIAGWRHPRAADNALCDIDYFRHLGQTAERGLFDGVFLADYVGYHPVKGADVFSGMETPKLDPALVLSTIAACTRHVGLIGTASTTYSHPYDLARRFASLDHLSRGRAGWNIVTSTMENEAHNYGRPAHMEHGERYARAAEFVEVARKLWDSWQDGAVRADKASGRYTDPSRISAVNHVGAEFRVAGPLTVPRSPQGHPVLVQAGASATGQRFAASCAEVIFTSHPGIETAKTFRAAMHAHLAEFGRTPDTLKIMPAVTPVIGHTRAAAEALQRELDSLIPADIAIAKLGSLLGNIDLSACSPHEPLPPLPPSALEGQNSTRDRVLELAARERPPLAELARRVAAGRTGRTIVGTATDVADELAAWEAEGAADGFVIAAPFLPGGLEDFVDQVVPILQQRGLFRTAYEGKTLRENLGLARPVNRFEADPSLRQHPEIW